MGRNTGIRSPYERFIDWWAELNMWSKFGLSFVAAIALIYLVIEILGLFATLGS